MTELESSLNMHLKIFQNQKLKRYILLMSNLKSNLEQEITWKKLYLISESIITKRF